MKAKHSVLESAHTHTHMLRYFICKQRVIDLFHYSTEMNGKNDTHTMYIHIINVACT